MNFRNICNSGKCKCRFVVKRSSPDEYYGELGRVPLQNKSLSFSFKFLALFIPTDPT